MPAGKREPEWKRERIVELRTQEKLTTTVIAERLGTSTAFVSYVLKEKGLSESKKGRPRSEG